MTEPDDPDTTLDTALRRRFRDGGEPADAGFSLRVMATLPAHVAPQRRRRAGWIRRAQWAAISLAACAVPVLLSGGRMDTPHALAALALTGLLIYWTLPSRWNPG